MKPLKLHKVPRIDKNQRDPIMESYQDCDSKETKETTAVDRENINGNGESPKICDFDEMQDDDGLGEKEDKNHIYDTFLREYTDEELESCEENDIHLILTLQQEKVDKVDPNFKILEEYQKRVCIFVK